MSKAAELAKAGETLTNQPSGRKNLVTNGAMQVAQRSASETGLGAAAGYFTLDRWKIDTANSAGRLTMTQTADGPSGFANCLKLDCTTADTSLAASEHLIISQRFEGQDLQQIKKGTSDAELITISFYVKASAAFTFGVELYDADNARQITKLYTTTTGWVRHELTFPADTTGAFDDDNLESLQLGFWLHAGSTFASGTLNTAAWASNTNANRAAGIDSFYSSTDNNFFLTGVQMEIGSQATNFEHRSFGEELALCERYCTVYKTNGEGQIPHSSATVDLANRPEILLLYPKKRANPSIAVVNPTNFKLLTAADTAVAATGYGGTYLGTGPDSAIMFWNVSSGVATNTLSGIIQQLLIFQNTGSITIDAEL